MFSFRGTGQRDRTGHLRDMSRRNPEAGDGTGRDTPLKGCPMSSPLSCPSTVELPRGEEKPLVWEMRGSFRGKALGGSRSPDISRCEGNLDSEKPSCGGPLLWGMAP